MALRTTSAPGAAVGSVIGTLPDMPRGSGPGGHPVPLPGWFGRCASAERSSPASRPVPGPRSGSGVERSVVDVVAGDGRVVDVDVDGLEVLVGLGRAVVLAEVHVVAVVHQALIVRRDVGGVVLGVVAGAVVAAERAAVLQPGVRLVAGATGTGDRAVTVHA